MRTTPFECECLPGSASGLIESMDAAGFEVAVRPAPNGLLARFFAAFRYYRTHHAQPHGGAN